MTTGLGSHICKRCEKDVHSHVMCDKVWMPDYGMYFCSKSCISQYNSKGGAGGDGNPPSELMPLRRRPDEAIEPADQDTAHG